MKSEREEGDVFQDRSDAGHWLAQALASYRGPQTIVLGLPRGGVPVAYEVARALDAPLDVWVVRELGAPLQPEFGIGAIAEGDATYVDMDDALAAGATAEYLEEMTTEKRREVEQRVRAFRGGRPPPELRGKTVIAVDDGIATGRTVRAAVMGIRKQRPEKLVLATPVAAAESLRDLAPLVDAVVCPQPERHLFAIGEFYADFRQTSDEEVIALLERARREREAQVEPAPAP